MNRLLTRRTIRAPELPAARLAAVLAALLVAALPVRGRADEAPVSGEKPAAAVTADQRPSLLVMHVVPRADGLEAAGRGARESLVRVLKGLDFTLYSPADLAKLMTLDEQKKLLGDNSTGNLMALGRRAGAERVVYCEIESFGKTRTLRLSLLPSSARGPIRYAKADYAINASDAEMDLSIANALIDLFGWSVKQ